MCCRRAAAFLFAASFACSLFASELDITPATLTNGDYGVLFHRVITVTGGTPPYTSITVTDFEAGGSGVAAPVIDLQAGTITFDSTPTNDSIHVTFTVSATDSANASTSRSYDVQINFELGFNPPFIPGEAVVGFGLGVYTEIGNGTPPYTSLEVLDFDPGGTGTEPPVADLANHRVVGNSIVQGEGVATFRVRATDSAGAVATQDFSVIVDSTLHFTPKTLSAGAAGTLYSHALIAVHETAQCCDDVSVTSFDDGGTGLEAPAASTVAGTITFQTTPTAAGTATVGVHIANDGATFDGIYTIVIHPALTISPATLPEGTVGEPYDQVVTVSGGVTPYLLIRLQGYGAASAGVPTPTIDRAAGTMTFDGMPTSGTVVNMNLMVYDQVGSSAVQGYSFVVAWPLSIAPATLPDGAAGQAYFQTLTVDGGTLPYTTLSVDAFNAGGTGLAAPSIDAPAGTITFDSVPAAGGTVSFSIHVVDSFGRTLTRNDSIVIHPAAPLGILATASASSAIAVSWSASAGASAYEVERSANGVSYAVVGGTSSLALTDTTANANTAYLYRVRAVSPSASPYSAPDLATAIVFTDPSLPGVPIRAVHFTQMRTAVNSVRALAGLTSFTFANGPVVLATHLIELRDALALARAALALPALSFTQPSITSGATTILAVDVQELRDGVR